MRACKDLRSEPESRMVRRLEEVADSSGGGAPTKKSFLPLQLNDWLGKNLRSRSTLLAAMPRMREYVR